MRRFSDRSLEASPSGRRAPNTPTRKSAMASPLHSAGRNVMIHPSTPSSTAGSNSYTIAGKIFDDPAVMLGYDSVPLIPVDTLPRGGVSLETKSVGRIQFGIPPETIKDSMLLGMGVPSVYIVPVERFCREMGPALGINVAEFEFPAYFNYFVHGKRCTLVVDSTDAEEDIRNVFGETLLGPREFRNHDASMANLEEDFDPTFPEDRRPNFYKEFYNFRTAEKSTNYQELTIDTLLKFCHFQRSQQGKHHPITSSGGSFCSSSTNADSGAGRQRLGVPPTLANVFDLLDDEDDEIMLKGSNHNNGDPVPTPPAPRRRKSRRRRSLLTSEEMEELGAISEDGGGTGDSSIDSTSRHRTASVGDFSEMPGVASRASAMRSSVDAPPPPPLNAILTGHSPALGREGRRGSMPGSTTEGRQIPTVSRRGSAVTSNTERRGSISTVASESAASRLSNASQMSYSLENMSGRIGMEDNSQTWMYSQVKWLGEVATIYPNNATEEQCIANSVARVEIFKMAGGTEYIIHDVDKDGVIIGKARISGTVKVPDELSVEGFLSSEAPTMEKADGIFTRRRSSFQIRQVVQPPTFHPPSFGVTVLGNSHGFDKNGATSGYVLWINGRGIMVDPPPFSSATLEREGIRPLTIMAIILTHCHADHDAGAFQKIMTGSRVAIITTPTIYKSFIRKYSALSGLRSSLLRHSHRHRPAIIGQPLCFQGAVFHFSYTLHTIPCISFKVEWRGRSIVFTGDHLNSPPVIDGLEKKGVLSKGRADDLRNLPLQPCDVLLHEAGAPPIHTPLKVLEELPSSVRDRLYVVHTAAIPPESDLRVAPTGTSGTIRLDSILEPACNDSQQKRNSGTKPGAVGAPRGSSEMAITTTTASAIGTTSASTKLAVQSLQDGSYPNITVVGNYSGRISEAMKQQFQNKDGSAAVPPLVFLRPTCVSDSWFILNLLSAVPFFSTLSYAHTMEILEIAQVEMYATGETVVEGSRRADKLCVFWEGTCVERDSSQDEFSDSYHTRQTPAIWHAGDWTGPISLQPDASMAAGKVDQAQSDIIAVSVEGVKVIVLTMKDLHNILKAGSKLYRKYLQEQEKESNVPDDEESYIPVGRRHFLRSTESDGIIEVLRCNSVLGSLPAVQKRHLESLAEGTRYFASCSNIWTVGNPVEHAYIVVKGTATFSQPKAPPKIVHKRMNRRGSTGAIGGDANQAMLELQNSGSSRNLAPSADGEAEADKVLQNVHPNSEYSKVVLSLEQRRLDVEDEMDTFQEAIGVKGGSSMYFGNGDADRTNQDRFANKVLARLYARHAFIDGLIFSRGMFLSDTSRMISGDLASIHRSTEQYNDEGQPYRHNRNSIHSMVGTSASDHHNHTSNLRAGGSGCLVLIFPRASLIPFLDSNPGVLLALLGTQVVV